MREGGVGGGGSWGCVSQRFVREACVSQRSVREAKDVLFQSFVKLPSEFGRAFVCFVGVFVGRLESWRNVVSEGALEKN